jgi:hypothetical protein
MLPERIFLNQVPVIGACKLILVRVVGALGIDPVKLLGLCRGLYLGRTC